MGDSDPILAASVMSLPSAPVASTIALTFLANSLRLPSVADATLKPCVSPQPPIATMIAVPGENCARAVSTVVKNGQDEVPAWLKAAGLIKARATWVMSETRDNSGTTLCWLDVLQQLAKGSGAEIANPVRYMIYLLLALRDIIISDASMCINVICNLRVKDGFFLYCTYCTMFYFIQFRHKKRQPVEP
jgi:hypothetical protein